MSTLLVELAIAVGCRFLGAYANRSVAGLCRPTKKGDLLNGIHAYTWRGMTNSYRWIMCYYYVFQSLVVSGTRRGRAKYAMPIMTLCQ